MSEYDRQRDIAAEGQRAAIFHGKERKRQEGGGLLKSRDVINTMAARLWAIGHPAGFQTRQDLIDMANECLNECGFSSLK